MSDNDKPESFSTATEAEIYFLRARIQRLEELLRSARILSEERMRVIMKLNEPDTMRW